VIGSLTTTIDTDALLSGFAFGVVLMVITWAAIIGLQLLRRLLSDASEL
jgi:hypothetical protein